MHGDPLFILNRDNVYFGGNPLVRLNGQEQPNAKRFEQCLLQETVATVMLLIDAGFVTAGSSMPISAE